MCTNWVLERSPSIFCRQLWRISFRYKWRQHGIAINNQYATDVQCWWGWYQWRGVLFLEENRNNGCDFGLSRTPTGIYFTYFSTLPRNTCTCCCDLLVAVYYQFFVHSRGCMLSSSSVEESTNPYMRKYKGAHENKIKRKCRMVF